MDFINDVVHENGGFAGWGIPTHVKEQNAIENTMKVLAKARAESMKIIHIKVEYEEGWYFVQIKKDGYETIVDEIMLPEQSSVKLFVLKNLQF